MKKRSRESMRAQAIREYKFLCRKLLNPWHTVEQINRAFSLKREYNL